MAKVPKSLTTVTLFSKILALIILVLIIPMASFYAGMQYQKTATIGQLDLPTAVTHAQMVQSLAEKSVRDYLVKYTTSTTFATQHITTYKLYLPQNIIEGPNQLTFDITFSVMPFSKQASSYWLSGNGVLEPDGWITGKKMHIKAVKKNGLYQIVSIVPSL